MSSCTEAREVRVVQRVRLRRAVLVMALTGAAVLAGDVVFESLSFASLLSSPQEFQVSETEETWTSFGEEVLPLDAYSSVQMNDDGSVVGFLTDASSEKAFGEIAACLRTRGWAEVPSGSNTEGSFVKSTGWYSWVYVSCIQIGDSTSVVVQCVAGAGKEKK